MTPVTLMHRATRTRRPVRRGFSLIELMVVIGVILVLLSLVLGVSTILARSAESRETESVLQLIDTAVKDWQVSADRKLTFGTNGQPNGDEVYDIQATVAPEDLIREVLRVISRQSGAREIIAKINDDFLRRDLDTNEQFVIDSWDNPIIVVFPGPPGNTDDDGTERTLDEDTYGVCRNRQVLFVSYGPDGRPGSRATTASDQLAAEATDNVYSYEPERP